jgi:oligopeptidase B
VLYSVEHFKNTWWMISNADNSANFQLWTSPVGGHDWTRVLDPETEQPLLDGIAIEDLSIFARHAVVQGREDGIPRLWVLTVGGDDDGYSNVLDWQRLEWTEEPAHYVELSRGNGEFNTTTIIVEYQSLVTPLQQIEVNLHQPEQRTVLHEVPVPGYQKELYGCKRIQLPSRDGTAQIPVSLVYGRSTLEQAESKGKHVPIHLYGYGAYGVSVEDTFSSSRIPLLDRGMIYAIAHVRGGGELGRPWYQDGKLLNKQHTFDDFVDVARFLQEKKEWTNSELLSCEGRSAGGLTIGAALNQAPELFRAAILGVPFVDLIATMLDASIPLTAGEWEEWGNPNEEEYFEYMMEYSPMNNVQPGTTYPSMLLLAGLFDPRVAYWEPAKFAATLRHAALPKKDRPICLKTDMTSGHFSASDRYKHVKAKAFDYAFVLENIGIAG